MTDPVNTDVLRMAQEPLARIRDRVVSTGQVCISEIDRDWDAVAASIRAAADEVDRLRVALVEARAASDRYSQALSECREQSMLNEGRLRAVIENAPHAHRCDQFWELGKRAAMPCTCWKAGAL